MFSKLLGVSNSKTCKLAIAIVSCISTRKTQHEQHILMQSANKSALPHGVNSFWLVMRRGRKQCQAKIESQNPKQRALTLIGIFVVKLSLSFIFQPPKRRKPTRQTKHRRQPVITGDERT